MGLIVLTATNKPVSDDYAARRVWPIQDCRDFIRDVRKWLRGTDYACIMGSNPSLPSKPTGRMTYNWIFEAVRTSTGCRSYFQQCDLDDLVKKGECEPSPQIGPVRLPPDQRFLAKDEREDNRSVTSTPQRPMRPISCQGMA